MTATSKLVFASLFISLLFGDCTLFDRHPKWALLCFVLSMLTAFAGCVIEGADYAENFDKGKE